jgi:hypothetical protein
VPGNTGAFAEINEYFGIILRMEPSGERVWDFHNPLIKISK